MARGKRGTGNGRGRPPGSKKGKKPTQVKPPEISPVMPSESEESSGSLIVQPGSKPSTTLITKAHKKFGKFRCLLGDTTASDSEVTQEASQEASQSVDEKTPIENDKIDSAKPSEDTVDYIDDYLGRITVGEPVEVKQEEKEVVVNFMETDIQDIKPVESQTESQSVQLVSTTQTIPTQMVPDAEEMKTPKLSPSSNDATNDSIVSDSSHPTKMEATESVRRSTRIKIKSETRTKSRGHGLVQTKAALKQKYEDLAVGANTPVKVKQRWRHACEMEAAEKDVDPILEARLKQFVHLKENLYLAPRVVSRETETMTCECFLTREEFERGEYGCGDDCLNRLLMIECGKYCGVNERCTNKRFQNCRYSPVEVFRTEKKGLGMRAIAEIQQGDFIMEYIGEVVDQDEFERRADAYSMDKSQHFYFMSLRADAIIDATKKGSISRFINHSCDPNAETQKWTVNGELRIGFFARRNVSPGEEVTFDYQFQRYGKEAQKCYCESPLCRGWIGEEPDDDVSASGEEDDESDGTPEDAESKINDLDASSKSDISTVEGEVKVVKKQARAERKRREPKKRDYQKRKPLRADKREDIDLDVEIDKLCESGIKNRVHTLTVSRLLVRACDASSVSTKTLAPRLLELIRNAELPCRRLFLDYHGLRLLHAWMAPHVESDVKIQVLKTLQTLPIPHKTMLMDSHVLDTVTKWSSGEGYEHTKPEPSDVEKSGDDTIEPDEIKTLSTSLLDEWQTLKEVFRIPKKERIEQMKEHEREADKADKSLLDDRADDRSSRYDRYRVRPNSVLTKTPKPFMRINKFERRQLFEQQVAEKDLERRRQQEQAEKWREHETRCLAMGIDPRQPFQPQIMFLPTLPPPVMGNIPTMPPIIPPPPPPTVKLPPFWKVAFDAKGRPYYYHIWERVPQWRPPPMDEPMRYKTIVKEFSESESSDESDTFSENSSSSASSSEDTDDDDAKLMLDVRTNLGLTNKLTTNANAVLKKPRENLVQAIIISPRTDEDKAQSRIVARQYKENKEKLRRKKEAVRLKKLVKRTERVAGASNVPRSTVIAQRPDIPQDVPVDSDKEQRIKNHFRKKMADIMVHILSPYTKDECKTGRITNTDDFKHLAKKLTMFVMLKELKNCKHVYELTVTESVKGKAREFVKKYMAKFGEVYQRPKDEMATLAE